MSPALRARLWYRRRHAVHPTRYRTPERRLLCVECWDELTPETAARDRGNPAGICKPCYRLRKRLAKRRERARRRLSLARNLRFSAVQTVTPREECNKVPRSRDARL